MFEDLVIDHTSPSGLRWSDTVSKRYAGKPVGCLGANGYYHFRYKQKAYSVHRVILEKHLGRNLGKDEVVDHIDGNPLNNALSNLRVCSRSQNGMNSKGRKSSTGIKGVRLRKDGRYYVSVRVLGVDYWGGIYDSLLEAKSAMVKLREKFHGQFARFR